MSERRRVLLEETTGSLVPLEYIQVRRVVYELSGPLRWLREKALIWALEGSRVDIVIGDPDTPTDEAEA